METCEEICKESEKLLSPLPRVSVSSRPYKNKQSKGGLLCIILLKQALLLIPLSPTLGKSLAQ
jgi:hypothetical protein